MLRQLSNHPDAVRSRQRRARARLTSEGSQRASPDRLHSQRCADSTRARAFNRSGRIAQGRSSQAGRSLDSIASFQPSAMKNP